MTVKQIKESLKDCSDDLDVFIEQSNDEYKISMVEKVAVERRSFTDGSLKAKHKVLVISDTF